MTAILFWMLAVSAVNALLQVPVQGYHAAVHPISRNLEPLQPRTAFGLVLDNLLVYYQIELALGTPSQKAIFTIDTGSSDLWVTATENPYCTNQTEQISLGYGINCTGERAFNYEDSSTLKVNGSGTADFSIQYADLTSASGLWVRDTIKIGDNYLQQAEFAVATKSNSSQSVFGIGLQSTESTYLNSKPGQRYVYDNVPILLKKQGIIKSVAYSLWLNDINSLQGELLFGGIDHAKYSGTMGIVPIVPLGMNIPTLSTDPPKSLAVMLHAISISNGNNHATVFSCSLPALLDSGSTAIYLPQDAVDSIGQSIGATYDPNLDSYLYPCNLLGFIRFNFSGVKIKVPLSYLGRPVTYTTGDPASDDNGNEICALMMHASDPDAGIILGDAFLRGAYVVYDLDNLQIGLANVRANATSSDVEEIVTGIPSATSAPSYTYTRTNFPIDTQVVTTIIGTDHNSDSINISSLSINDTETMDHTMVSTTHNSGTFTAITISEHVSRRPTTTSFTSTAHNGDDSLQPHNCLFGIISTFLLMIL